MHAQLVLKSQHVVVLCRQILVELSDQSRRRELFKRETGDREVCAYVHDAVGRDLMEDHFIAAGLHHLGRDELRLRTDV